MTAPQNSKKKSNARCWKTRLLLRPKIRRKKQRPALEIETHCTLRFEKKQRPVLAIETGCALRFEKKQRPSWEVRLAAPWDSKIATPGSGNWDWLHLEIRKKSSARCWELRLAAPWDSKKNNARCQITRLLLRLKIRRKNQRSVLEIETDFALRFEKYVSLVKENLVYSKHENSKQLTWRWWRKLTGCNSLFHSFFLSLLTSLFSNLLLRFGRACAN